MENQNTQPNETPVPEVTGPVTDDMVVERLLAASKAKPSKSKIKAKHTVAVVEATAFGAINKKSISVEREVTSKAELPEDEKKAALEKELDDQMKAKLGHAVTPISDERLEKAKEIRNTLTELWSTEASQTDPNDDKYITGLPKDGNGATVNENSGDSGVRITFQSKKE